MSHRLPIAPPCPTCGTTLDGVTESRLDDSHPTPGDVSVCAYCSTVLMFTGDGDTLTGLRVVTDDEYVDLPAGIRREVARVAAAIRLKRPDR
jgi:hypothetical protein